MTARKPIFLNSSFGGLSEFSATDSLIAAQYAATGLNGVAFDAGSNRLSNVADPQNPQDAATKSYADNIAQGITFIPSVRVVSTGNVTQSGLPTVDGVTLVAGDRILCIGQTNAVTNGVFLVAAGAWTRPSGAGGVSDFTTGRAASGLTMAIREGTNFADLLYSCITDGSPKIDTDAVQFTQIGSLGQVIAGNGLQKSTASGNTISAQLAFASGLQFTAGAIDTLLNASGGLSKNASGLAVALNSNNTLAVDAQGLRTLGLPSLFTVAGTATSSNVSAANLNTLTASSTSQADALHTHGNVLTARSTAETLSNGSAALAAGDAVVWSSTASTLARGDASTQTAPNVIGVAAAAISANGSGVIVRRGIASGVLSQATPGAPVYLNAGGGYTYTFPTAQGVSAVQLGTAVNAQDLDVNIRVIIVRNS